MFPNLWPIGSRCERWADCFVVWCSVCVKQLVLVCLVRWFVGTWEVEDDKEDDGNLRFGFEAPLSASRAVSFFAAVWGESQRGS